MANSNEHIRGAEIASESIQIKSKVLIVEDELILAHATKLLINKLGYDVCGIATNGEEALRLELETQPDVILVDIDIPGKFDGIGVAAEIRKYRRVPIVYASARRDEHTLRRVQSEGPVFYLLKPYEPFQLRFALETAIRKCDLRTRMAKWEDQSRLLFENNPLPMWIIDTERLNFLEVNDAAVRHYGYSKSEFREMSLVDIRPPEEVPVLLSYLSSVTIAAGPAGIWHHKKKDGSRITVEIAAHDLDWFGRQARFVTAMDITEKEAIEQCLMRLQRVQGIGGLALGIAHDLNNIFAPILLSAQMLEDADNSEKQTLRDTIIASAERGSQMVQQLLSFAKGCDSARVVVNVMDVIDDVLKVTRETFPRSILFKPVIEAGLWHVIGDPTQLYQLFLNLSVNARDAMPNGGTLMISAQNVDLTQKKTTRFGTVNVGAHVLLSVADTGHGMDEEVEKKLFTPFFSTKTQGKGTGLGLSIVLSIVRNHLGCLDVKSKSGSGTKIEIYLPATPVRHNGPEQTRIA